MIKLYCKQSDLYPNCLIKSIIEENGSLYVGCIRLFELLPKEEHYKAIKIDKNIYKTIKSYKELSQEDLDELYILMKQIHNRIKERKKDITNILGLLQIFLENNSIHINPRLGLNVNDGIVLLHTTTTMNIIKYTMRIH